MLLAAYGLFGAGYIAYITFIVAFLAAGGAGPGQISVCWVILGGAAIGAGFGWGGPRPTPRRARPCHRAGGRHRRRAAATAVSLATGGEQF